MRDTSDCFLVKCFHFSAKLLMYFVAAHDGAEPSGNSIACSNLLRLAAFLDRSELKNKAARLLRAFGKGLTEIPIMFPQMTLALLDYHYTTQVHIIFVCYLSLIARTCAQAQTWLHFCKAHRTFGALLNQVLPSRFIYLENRVPRTQTRYWT